MIDTVDFLVILSYNNIMSGELADRGTKKNVGVTETAWERVVRIHNEQMKAVKKSAMGLLQRNPDQFSIERIGIDNPDFAISADFDVELDKETGKSERETVGFSLRFEMIPEGSGSSEINISIKEKDNYRRDRLEYRLDTKQGREVKAEYTRISELNQTPPTLEADRDIRQVLSTMMFQWEEDGSLSRYRDNYSESTIDPETALFLLENAQNLRRPMILSYPRGVSFGKFIRTLAKDQGAKPDISKLLK